MKKKTNKSQTLGKGAQAKKTNKSVSAKEIGCSIFAVSVFDLMGDAPLPLSLAAAGDDNLTKWIVKVIVDEEGNLDDVCLGITQDILCTAKALAIREEDNTTVKLVKGCMGSLKHYTDTGDDAFKTNAVRIMKHIADDANYTALIKVALTVISMDENNN